MTDFCPKCGREITNKRVAARAKRNGKAAFCSISCARKRRKKPIELFTERVSPEPNTGCWIWTGPYGKKGYGMFARAKEIGTPRYAHRWSYEIYKGPLGGMNACHSCDNTWCVNPDHLFAGTTLDNFRDAQSKDRHARRERHGRAKLTEKEVAIIRSSLDTQSNLAAKYGVSLATISRVLSKKIWIVNQSENEA